MGTRDAPYTLILIAALVIAAATIAAGTPASGKVPSVTEQTLYRFCSQSNCADGAYPRALSLMDGTGSIYGTTSSGGTGYGAVFQLTPSGSGWSENVLYTFCSQGNCADGAYPNSGLIMDEAGNLYGTTSNGGTANGGTVFQLTPSSGGWGEKVLYSFCSQSKCADGDQPVDGLVMDGAGNLYGTTIYGGDGVILGSPGYGFYLSPGYGVVFKLTPDQNKTAWTETLLYKFCRDCGWSPRAGLIMDEAGNLYGTTSAGGNTACNGYGCGVAFKLTPTSSGWTETVLYTFCSQSNCLDGANPHARLTMDEAGNLHGTTEYGGTSGKGVVFKLTPTNTAWSQTVLWHFCSQTNCTDGANASSVLLGPGLIVDGGDNLYGATPGGGTAGMGVVFKLTPTTTGWTETIFYNFCSQSNCTDGSSPQGLLMDVSGNLYGATSTGGNSACYNNTGCGVVFALNFGNYPLSVSLVGKPGGKVTSSPAGIDCGSTCSASFAAGTQVTLTAGPATAWGLAGWGGACSGIGGCSVTMNANTSVSASFTTLFTAAQPPFVTSPADVTLPPPIIAPVPQ